MRCARLIRFNTDRLASKPLVPESLRPAWAAVAFHCKADVMLLVPKHLRRRDVSALDAMRSRKRGLPSRLSIRELCLALRGLLVRGRLGTGTEGLGDFVEHRALARADLLPVLLVGLGDALGKTADEALVGVELIG